MSGRRALRRRTEAAVIAFQKWTGLARDGIPSPITQRELEFAKRPTPRTKRRGARVEILLGRQLLLFIRRGRVQRALHVSTGRRGFRTPTGEYSVLRKRRRSWSIPYEVRLPWASYFVGGLAIHQSATVPVLPASHGCVRVTRYDVRWLFRRTPVGTPVTVLRRS
jgi:lipoprotein-anchoring transpeptidase ErfK/SrfK